MRAVKSQKPPLARFVVFMFCLSVAGSLLAAGAGARDLSGKATAGDDAQKCRNHCDSMLFASWGWCEDENPRAIVGFFPRLECKLEAVGDNLQCIYTCGFSDMR